MAADREITVSATSPGVWAGRTASASALFDPATLVPCGTSVADVCDTTLVHVDGDGTLALELKAGEGTPDVDLYVYRSDSFGFAGALAGVAAESGADEAVRLPNASGTYLVRAVSFATGSRRVRRRGHAHAAVSRARRRRPPRPPGDARQRPSSRSRVTAGRGREPSRP